MNGELEELLRVQRSYTVTSSRLRARLLESVRELVLDRYSVLVELAAQLPFSDQPGKYLRWRDRSQLDQQIALLLQGLPVPTNA